MGQAAGLNTHDHHPDRFRCSLDLSDQQTADRDRARRLGSAEGLGRCQSRRRTASTTRFCTRNKKCGYSLGSFLSARRSVGTFACVSTCTAGRVFVERVQRPRMRHTVSLRRAAFDA